MSTVQLAISHASPMYILYCKIYTVRTLIYVPHYTYLEQRGVSLSAKGTRHSSLINSPLTPKPVIFNKIDVNT